MQKKNRDHYAGFVSKKDVKNGQRILETLLSENENTAYKKVMDSFTRAELAEKHSPWSKNRNRAEKYLQKYEAYLAKGNNARYGSWKQRRYWNKAFKYDSKYSHLSSD